jgi:hypothetical protein
VRSVAVQFRSSGFFHYDTVPNVFVIVQFRQGLLVKVVCVSVRPFVLNKKVECFKNRFINRVYILQYSHRHHP